MNNRLKIKLKKKSKTTKKKKTALRKKKIIINKKNIKMNEKKITMNEKKITMNEKKININEKNRLMNEKKITLKERKRTLNKEKITMNEKNIRRSQFKCPICPRELSRALGLMRHLIFVHDKMGESVTSGQKYPIDESTLRPATKEEKEYYCYGKAHFERLKRLGAIKKTAGRVNNTSALNKTKFNLIVSHEDGCKIEPSDETTPVLNEPPGADANATSVLETKIRFRGKTKILKKRRGLPDGYRVVSNIESSDEAMSDESGPPSACASIEAVSVPNAKRFKVGKIVGTLECSSSNNTAVACTDKLGGVSGKTLTRVSDTYGEHEVIKWTVLDNTRIEIVEDWPINSALLPKSSGVNPSSVEQITSSESATIAPQITSHSVPEKKSLNDCGQINRNDFEKKIGRSQGQFKCPICPRELTRALGMMRHLIFVHDKSVFPGQKYPIDESTLRPATKEDKEYYSYGKRHFERLKRLEAKKNSTAVGSLVPFKCPICLNVFRCASDLMRHLVFVHDKMGESIYPINECSLRPATKEDKEYYCYGRVYFEQLKRGEAKNNSAAEIDFRGKPKLLKKKRGLSDGYRVISNIESSDDVVPDESRPPSAGTNIEAVSVPNAKRFKVEKIIGTLECSSSKKAAVTCTDKLDEVSQKSNTGHQMVKCWSINSTLLPTPSGVISSSVEQINLGESSAIASQIISPSVPEKESSSDCSQINENDFEKKIGRSQGQFKCPICPKELTRALGLMRHLVFVHEQMGESVTPGQKYLIDESTLRSATDNDREYYCSGKKHFEQLKRREARKKKRGLPKGYRVISNIESSNEAVPDGSGAPSADANIEADSVTNGKRFKVKKIVGTLECSSSSKTAVTCTDKLDEVSGKTITGNVKYWSNNSALLPASSGVIPSSVEQINSAESSDIAPQITSPVVPEKNSSNDCSQINRNDFNVHGMLGRLMSQIREFPPPWNSDQLLERARDTFPDVEVSMLKMAVLSIVTASRMCATHIMSSSLRESLRESRSTQCDKVHLDENLTQSYMDSI